MPAVSLPDPTICEQARRSRDARFDGLFFTAVATTGIYCRPTCPAPPAKARNVDYYPSAAAAEAAGFRPCLRCRPELSPGDGSWRRGDGTLARALKLIDEGFLAEAPLAALADRVHVGERQLRRLFTERLGAPPIGVHGTRRLLFAKQLLTETALPITEVALPAGFSSLRRFNACFRDAYGLAPRQLRQRPGAATGDVLTLRLNYRPPYDFAAMLDFLRGRALPGVERVEAGVRRFARAADPQAIAEVLSRDGQLRPLLHARPGLRMPSGWDGFEIAVRAVVGQQVSVTAARTITARLAQRHGTPLPPAMATSGLLLRFPTPGQLAEADLSGIGLPTARAATIRGISRALVDGHVDFRAGGTLDEFVERWTALPGIGPWTAHYIAMRALGHPDAFPAGDLVLHKQLLASDELAATPRLRTAALARRAEAWRPW